MALTKQQVQERLEALFRKERDALDTVQAVHGAIQDCQWFLEQFEEETEENADG